MKMDYYSPGHNLIKGGRKAEVRSGTNRFQSSLSPWSYDSGRLIHSSQLVPAKLSVLAVIMKFLAFRLYAR